MKLFFATTVMLAACAPTPLTGATQLVIATVTVSGRTTTPIAIASPQSTPSAAPDCPACIQKASVQTMNKDLVHSAERGDTPAVLRLVQQGADIDGRDERGRTPVMAATHGNKVDTARALIRAGADLNLQDNLKDNPFLYASAEGLLEILKLTIDAGANTKLTNRFGGTALIPAAERGHVEIVTELLRRTDVDINHVNNLGWTALLEAIILGDGGPRRTEVVRLLVNAGANVNLADGKGVTPLTHARQRGYGQIISILQNAGSR